MSGFDDGRARALEVRQRWGEAGLEVRAFTGDRGQVRAGCTVGHRWRLLGVDLGEVPGWAAWVLPGVLPFWSEVHPTLLEDFVADGRQTLAERVDGAWWIPLHPGLTLRSGGQALDPEADRVVDGRVRLDDADAELILGSCTFEIREVARPRPVDRPSTAPDAGLVASLLVLGACAALLAVFVATAPAPPETHVIEIPERMMQLVMHTPPKPPPKRAVEPTGAGPGPSTDATPALKQEPRSDREIARSAGVLGSGALDALGADSPLDTALAASIGLIGARGRPGGSLWSRGSSLGGGGEVEGLGGAWGRPGGSPGGTGDGGPGADGLGDKQAGALLPTSDALRMIGNMPASVVDEVVRRHLSALRYCYQRELQRDPALAGKVTVKFVIAADGTVSSSEVRNSTMDNGVVERCLAGRFARMTFPKPAGGGIVVVSYPLVFTPG